MLYLISGYTRKVFKGKKTYLIEVFFKMLELEVYSDQVGSNPGGKCRIHKGRFRGDYYIKHCHPKGIDRSRFPRVCSFIPINQPIYEAITAQMANKLGLRIPECGVLCGEGVRFTGEFEYRIKQGLPFYFFSRLMPKPKTLGDALLDKQQRREKLTDEEIGLLDLYETDIKKVMDREEPYLDLLQITDITDRRDNYIFAEKPYGEGEIIYLDLGCSFVNAHNGELSMETKQRENNQRRKDFKNVVRAFKKFSVRPTNDSKYSPNLVEFLTGIGDLRLPVIDAVAGIRHELTADHLLDPSEIEEIGNILMYCNYISKPFKRLKQSGIIVKK